MGMARAMPVIMRVVVVVIVVPGWAGYKSDRTHKTFVDRAYLAEHDLLRCEGFRVESIEYFPLT